MSQAKKKNVCVLGAGIAGLTAAHELMLRDYDVTVVDKDGYPGGKAATQYPWLRFPGSGGSFRWAQVPAEHGFRLFPAFYRHVIDTMERTPFDRGFQPSLGQRPEAPARGLDRGLGQLGRRYRTVAENLVPTQEAATARHQSPPAPIRLAFGADFRGLLRWMNNPLPLAPEQATTSDIERFSVKCLQFLSSCQRRRDSVDHRHGYGKKTWWDFIGGPGYSPAFQNEVECFMRTLIALDAKRGNARTIGNVGMQLLLDAVTDGSRTDRVLNGPTSDQWLLHWESYLRENGVKFKYNRYVKGFHYSRRKQEITRVNLSLPDGGTDDGEAVDFVVSTLPLEAMQRLLRQRDLMPIVEADAQLEWIRDLEIQAYTAWMAGIQFYLHRDIPIVRGHVYYPEADWKLSSVSQAQFWGAEFFQLYGQNLYRGILSVDVCDWETREGRRTEGAWGRLASECTREAAAREIWEQLRYSLTVDDESLLPRELPPYWFDENIRFPEGLQSEDLASEESRKRARYRKAINLSPYFVPPAGSHVERPKACTAIRNLFLAGDYIMTHTDLATMEAANEAARHAVNGILEVDHRFRGEQCAIWPLEEPPEYDFLKQLDEDMFSRGEPHLFEALDVFGGLQLGGLSRQVALRRLGDALRERGGAGDRRWARGL